MTLSGLKRPLFWILVFYMLTLCFLHRRGAFDLSPPENLRACRFVPSVELTATLESVVRSSGKRKSVFAEASRIGDVFCRQKLLIFLPNNAEADRLKIGKILKIQGRLRLPGPPRNPGGFDQQDYLRTRGVTWVVYASRLEMLGQRKCWSDLPFLWAESLRQSIRNLFIKIYPLRSHSLLCGILLGDKGSLEPDLARAMKDAGAFHLIVPSGSNVAFVLAFFIWVFGRLALANPLRLPLALAMAAFYGMIVGGDPPYLRALICAALALLARLLGREIDMFQALILSALLFLIVEPRIIFQKGFQMSYMAVWALLVLQPHRLAPANWPRPVKGVISLVMTSAAAQFALLPLLAGIGGKFSLAGIFANVVLVPLSGLLLGLGFMLWGISFLPFPVLIHAAAVCIGLLVELFQKICFACAAMPGSALSLWPMPPLLILGYYMILFGAFLWRHPRIALRMAVTGLAIVLAACLLERVERRDFCVITLSLPGYGASLVRFPTGGSWLIYGSGAPQTVFKALKIYGIRKLERVVILEQSETNSRSRDRIAEGTLSQELVRWNKKKPFELCRGTVCFRFFPTGPRLFRGAEEYSRFPEMLRWNALAIRTDGLTATIQRAP